ncbi:MAG: SDR family oxidoreductase [Mycobacteriaceae bacterium]
MTKYLVTGSAGQLGAPTARVLRESTSSVIGLTRSGGPDTVTCDLLTGEGIDQALDGIDTVVHLATTNSAKDVTMARNLAAAAGPAGVGHLIVVSIVGIDRIPLGFYRDRVRIETILLESGVPLTIQRATQFHSFVDNMFTVQRFSPAIVGPSWRFQPIAVEDVARRLAELATGEPSGRVADIGGPEQRPLRAWHRDWKAAKDSKRPMWSIRLPGKLFAAYDAGANLVPGEPFGTRTFDDFLAEKYR